MEAVIAVEKEYYFELEEKREVNWTVIGLWSCDRAISQ